MKRSSIDATDADGTGRNSLSPDHRNYLAQRGILRAALKTGVHSITARRSRGGPVIAIPYGNGMFKTYDLENRDDPWRQIKPKAARLPLWRLDKIKAGEPLIITEGEWDALSFIEAGLANVSSLPDGAIGADEEAPAKSGKLACIREAWAKLSRMNPVVLAVDNDINGILTRDILIDIFGRWRCHIVDWPRLDSAQGANGRAKDANEVLLASGVEGVRALVEKAKPVKLEGVFKPREIVRGQPRQFYNPGIPLLDDLFKPFRGSLVVMTGHTGHGKTTVLLNILGYLAKEGLQIGLGSFEADFWEDLHPFYETWLFGKDKPQNSYDDTTAWLEERFTLIAHDIEPMSRPPNADWFVSQAQDCKGRYGCDVLVLDPWNKLQHTRKPGESESEYIGRALAEMRNFARVYNAVVIVTAHPTKAAIMEDGEMRVPGLGDIHGSMNWGNAADHVVITYRPHMNKTPTLIKAAKVRVRGSGRVGHRWYLFDLDTNRYRPAPEDFENETH